MTFNVCIYVQKVLAAESLSRRKGWQVSSNVFVCVCARVHICATHRCVYNIVSSVQRAQHTDLNAPIDKIRTQGLWSSVQC